MNIDQLKKQAKNLRKSFPTLVAAHGGQLTLAQAQWVIALINGYPSWEQMIAKSVDAELPRPSIEAVVRAGLYFDIDAEPSRLPIAYSLATGNPTRYEHVHEAILRFKHEKDKALADREDEELYAFMDHASGNSFDVAFTSLAADVLEELERRFRSSLQRAPLNIEGHSMLGGVLHARGEYPAAFEATEPVIRALIDLLPTDRKIQVPYGVLANRPFFRLLHCHLLVLDRLGRHPEANALAKLGLKLCPNDNIGFRYLKTQGSRARVTP
jgi:hypothetical protein